MVAPVHHPGHITTFNGGMADDVARARFSNAIEAECIRRRLEGKSGWNNPDVCTIAQLEAHVHEMLNKGDLAGAGAALMFLYNRVFPERPEE